MNVSSEFKISFLILFIKTSSDIRTTFKTLNAVFLLGYCLERSNLVQSHKGSDDSPIENYFRNVHRNIPTLKLMLERDHGNHILTAKRLAPQNEFPNFLTGPFLRNTILFLQKLANRTAKRECSATMSYPSSIAKYDSIFSSTGATRPP